MSGKRGVAKAEVLAATLILAVVTLLVRDLVQAEDLVLPRISDDRYKVRGVGTASATEDHRRLEPLTQNGLEQMLQWQLGKSAHDGGGADVTNATSAQIAFSNPLSGNEILLIWDEFISNDPGNVTIFVNGIQTASAPALVGLALPGTNFFTLTNVETGLVNFRLEGGETFTEVEMLVLDEQPFQDVTNFICVEGGIEPATNTCELVLTWDHAGPPVESFGIFVNGGFQLQVPGDFRRFTFTNAPAGAYAIGLQGLLTDSNGTYRSNQVASVCNITCDPVGCRPAYNPSVLQTDYTTNVGENRASMRWQNGIIPYPQGITPFFDGAALAPVDGALEELPFAPIPPGEHTFGVQGNCNLGDTSTITEVSLNLLEESPHPNPITGSVDCVFTPVGPVLAGTWTNSDPSTDIDVYVRQAAGLVRVTTLTGSATSVEIVGPLTADDTLVLQFFKEIDGGKYGSPFLECGDSIGIFDAKYIQGVCDGLPSGVGNPTLSSVIFSVQSLFQGGEAPPCQVACDSNGDQTFNLSDGIYSLGHLFQGGPAPLLWIDSDQDGSRDPTCTSAQAEDDCETGHNFCE